MSNIIVSQDLATVSNSQITARSETAGYPKVNVMDLWHLGQHFRAADKTANAYLLFMDFGSTVGLVATFLNDINFSHAQIQGSATANTPTHGDWAAPGYDSGSIAVAADGIVGRYKAYIAHVAFSYRYWRLYIPAGTTEIGSEGIGKWKIGTVVLVASATTFTLNMSYGYQRSASLPFEDFSVAGGLGVSPVNKGNLLVWQATLNFENFNEAEELDIWALNRMHPASPMVFFENQGDISKAYLCRRDSDYVGVMSDYNACGGSVRLKELVY